MTELAKHAGISKQSIAYLVDDLCQLGYLDLHEDPADGRAKQIRFSKRGRPCWRFLPAKAGSPSKNVRE